MTQQTLAADVIDALYGMWTAAAALTAYGDRLRIFDGPPVTDRSAEIELWVGATGLAPDETVIEGTQDWVTLGDAVADRDETLDVRCVVWVYSTTGRTISTCRRTALDVFNAAVTIIRGSDLGLPALDPTAAPVSWQLHQGQYVSGPGVALTFDIRVSGFL